MQGIVSGQLMQSMVAEGREADWRMAENQMEQ